MSNPLLAHLVQRLEADVDFLVSQGHISRPDANAFLQKLPKSNNSRVQMPAPPPAPAAPVAPALQQARALWAYNELGTEPDDLSFRAGDIIDIVKEENAGKSQACMLRRGSRFTPDWWLGRHNGKEALFPSAYVEKCASSPPSQAAAPAARRPYKPFGAAYHGRDLPPAQPQTVAPAPATNSIGLQQDVQGQQAKKSKLAPYGNTMAHSAAGGVGFGAGSAIGGGLVRAIF
ncbi:Myosin IE [Mycena kentingensis (nom. inval.)]|nr:Myosin IE [Mycena kentingensis (nom. inval.)]